MDERERGRGRREERPKPSRPADNRCSCCGTKVPDPAADDAHLCVEDEQGTVEHCGRKWRASTMREAREKCLAHGFVYHIGKPINPQALLATIKHLVFTNQHPKSFFDDKLSKPGIPSFPAEGKLTITNALRRP